MTLPNRFDFTVMGKRQPARAAWKGIAVANSHKAAKTILAIHVVFASKPESGSVARGRKETEATGDAPDTEVDAAEDAASEVDEELLVEGHLVCALTGEHRVATPQE